MEYKSPGNSLFTDIFQRFDIPRKVYSGVFLKHFSIAFILKCILLGFFYYEIKAYALFTTQGFFVIDGDTPSYYQPIENLLAGGSYGEPCRMPGLLPFYYLFRILFSQSASYNLIVLFQVLFATFSAVLLALISYNFSKSKVVYFAVLILYSLNSFTGIWDIFGMADSFSVSFFITSVYLLMNFFQLKKLLLVFTSGLFLAWSVFLRPIMLVALLTTLIVTIIYLFAMKMRFRVIIQVALLFMLSFLCMDGLWTYRNYRETNEFQPLAKQAGCYSSFTEQYYALIKIPIALGMDFTWNHSGEWFHKSTYSNIESPVKPGDFTSSFNGDSIIGLRSSYFRSLVNIQDTVQKQLVINKIGLFLHEYKHEHSFKYYFINPVKLFLKFLFPTRLDNLPFPALNKMNWFQKIVKAGYYLSLPLVNLLGLIYLVLLLFKPASNMDKIVLACIPLSVLAVLTFFLGYIEQRYFCAIYPFFFIFSILQVNNILYWVKAHLA